MGTVSFTFTETVSRSFILNGKRYTVKHKTMPSGTYRIAQPSPEMTPTNTRTTDDGHRICRACGRQRMARYRQRRIAA